MIRKVIILAICTSVFHIAHTTVIPFKLAGKLIVIEAFVNDQPGNYIIDTGISEMILNSAYFEGESTGEKIIGINGREMSVFEAYVKVETGDLKWNLVRAKTLPLEHLSRSKDLPIMGLIGTEILSLFNMTIDFETRTLELSKGKPRTQGWDRAPDATFRFWWKEGVPVIRMKAGEASLCFGLDTGAEINLLSVQKSKKIPEHLNLDQSRRIVGLKNRSQVLPAGQIHQIEIGEYLCPKMKVALTSMGRYNMGADGQRIDGIVGYEFLQNLKVTFNFKKRIIYAWNRHSLSEPYFVSR